MIQKDAIFQLKDRLLQNRSEIFHLVNEFENGWKDLREPETEFEENAQKEDISQLLGRLEDRERIQIQDIDAALQKIALGTYGYCESCGKSISMKRLDAVPAAKLCGKCARGMEVPRGTEVDMSEDTLPDEFKGMSDERLAEALYQYLLDDGRVELDHLEITCRYGAVILEGTLVTGFSRQLLLEILEDDLGFSRIEDLTHIEQAFADQGEEAEEERDKEELLQGEQVDEDMFESQESGTPVSPPEEIRLP